MNSTYALVADGLSKRYGRSTLALDGCTLQIPSNSIVALVGPNGAGKSTLLHLAVGLLLPTDGTIKVLGQTPGDATLPVVGFVAQDAPLYRDFSGNELLKMGDKLNAHFDTKFARERLGRINVPLDRPVAKLSGGQRAQIALCLALAKRPDLLLLDEPLASLDPLARRDFLGALMDAVAERPMTVVLSSHLIVDLERVCDYLIVLQAGRVQVIGETEELLDTHKVLIGPARKSPKIAGVEQIVSASKAGRQGTLLVRTNGPIHDPAWDVHDASLEDVLFAYLADASVEALLDGDYEEAER